MEILSQYRRQGGANVVFSYFANGNLKSSQTSGVTTTIEQDDWGRKKTLIDPSAGTYKYTYNNFGELTSEEIVGKGITNYNLDDYGRIQSKIMTGTGSDTTNTTTTYTYQGDLVSTILFKDNSANDFTINYSYQYDNFKRLILTKEMRTSTTVPLKKFFEFQREYLFDVFGRIDRERFFAKDLYTNKFSDKWIKNAYKNGTKWQILDMTNSSSVGATKLWQTNSVNENGKTVGATLGNGMIISNTYDSFGFPTQIKYSKGAANIMTLNTKFNPINGNLERRLYNNINTWDENILHDELDRLKKYNDNTGINMQTYNENGTILKNSIGDYAYTQQNIPSPYALTSITPEDQSANSAVINYYTNRKQEIGYNLFNSPTWIKEQLRENVDFEYNCLNNRSVMYYGNLETNKNSRIFKKFYSFDSSMEIRRKTVSGVSTDEIVTYIGGDAYTAPAIFKSDGGTIKDYFYLHRDYQGSILAITNSAGQVVERRLFDVWGSLIKYNYGTNNVVPSVSNGLFLDRGYTGHEHLLGVGLINMNGRIYDSKLHTFLQPDSNIQDPFNPQNYNRYGYCMNNPTKYTDPKGEFWLEMFAGMLFSSYAGGYTASGGEFNPFKWNSTTWTNSVLNGLSFGVTNYSNHYINTYDSNNIKSKVDDNKGEAEDHPYVYYEPPHMKNGFRGEYKVSTFKKYNSEDMYNLFAALGVGTTATEVIKNDIDKIDFFAGTSSTQEIYEKGYEQALSKMKFLNNTAEVISAGGYYLGYVESVDRFAHGDHMGAAVSAGSNYAAEYIAVTRGWWPALAFTLTWEFMDKKVSQTEFYNWLLFGPKSDVYRERGIENGWYWDNPH